jgi:hypothetical protein
MNQLGAALDSCKGAIGGPCYPTQGDAEALAALQHIRHLRQQEHISGHFGVMARAIAAATWKGCKLMSQALVGSLVLAVTLALPAGLEASFAAKNRASTSDTATLMSM